MGTPKHDYGVQTFELKIATVVAYRVPRAGRDSLRAQEDADAGVRDDAPRVGQSLRLLACCFPHSPRSARGWGEVISRSVVVGG